VFGFVNFSEDAMRSTDLVLLQNIKTVKHSLWGTISSLFPW